MIRRHALWAATLLAPTSTLVASCDSRNMEESPSQASIEVSIWAERQRGVSDKLASAVLVQSTTAPGLQSLRTPLSCKLPSGLRVEVSCEQIPSGEFHLGLSENDELVSMGKYAGVLAVRLFPKGHSPYVVNVERPGKRHGA